MTYTVFMIGFHKQRVQNAGKMKILQPQQVYSVY